MLGISTATFDTSRHKHLISLETASKFPLQQAQLGLGLGFSDVIAAGRASAVLAASLFHFGTFTIPQVKDYLAGHGVPVRR